MDDSSPGDLGGGQDPSGPRTEDSPTSGNSNDNNTDNQGTSNGPGDTVASDDEADSSSEMANAAEYKNDFNVPDSENESEMSIADLENPVVPVEEMKIHPETKLQMGETGSAKEQQSVEGIEDHKNNGFTGDNNCLHNQAAMASDRNKKIEAQSFENAHMNNLSRHITGSQININKNVEDNAVIGTNSQEKDERAKESKGNYHVAEDDSCSQKNVADTKNATEKKDHDEDLKNFVVILSGNRTIVAPQGEEALKWRFLFDCPQIQKELQDNPVMAGTKLEYKKGASPFIHTENAEEFKKDLECLLKKHVDSIQMHHMIIPDEAIDKFDKALELEDLFANMIVIAYRRKSSLYICGRKKHMEQAMENAGRIKNLVISLISKREEIIVNDVPSRLMKRWLDVHAAENIQFEFKEDKRVLFITGLESVIINTKEIIQTLLRNITSSQCRHVKNDLHLTFFEETMVLRYMGEILQNLVCTWETNKKDCCIVVTAFDKETCNKACEIIDAACVLKSTSLRIDETTKILPSVSWQQEASSICRELGGKMKIWLNNEEGILEYVHTRDIGEVAKHAVQGLADKWERQKYLTMEKQVAEHLRSDKQKLTNLQEKHSVAISFSRKTKKNSIIIQGIERNIQQALDELKRECSAILKPKPEALNPTFSWEKFECFYVPGSEAELILLRDSSVFITENNNEVKLKDPETGTEVIRILPEFTLEVTGTKKITADMVLPTDRSVRPVTFCCPKWNEGRSQEKCILEDVLGHLFKLISDLCGEAMLELKETTEGNWSVIKLLKFILMAYQQHVKVNQVKDRLFLSVGSGGWYDRVKGVVSKCYLNYTKTKVATVPHEDDPGYIPVTASGSASLKHIRVHVVKGVLTDRKEDVLVNSAHHTLNLDYGKVSQSLLKAAGIALQQECKKHNPNGIKPGEVVVTKAYNLKNSKLIFHGTFDMWVEKNEERLKKTMKEFVIQCLQRAEKEQMKSIAFPAIGTGLLKYPCKVVADCMFKAVEEYSQIIPSPSFITEVYFVIYNMDNDTVIAFDERMKLHEQEMEGTPVDLELPSPHGGARPKTKRAHPTPDLKNTPLKQKEQPVAEGTVSEGEVELTEAQCIENSEVTISQELMKKIPKGSLAEIRKRYKVEIDSTTFSIKGQLENLQEFEGYLRSLNGNYTEKDSLSASDDDDEEEFLSTIKKKAVDKISQVTYQMFKYFFSDLYVSFLQDVEVHFSGDERCIYVQGESLEIVDKITEGIRNAFTEMTKFQESDVSISREQLERAKQLVVEMNSGSPERQVYCYFCDPFAIHIVARTWEEVRDAKHKINLELGKLKITGRQKKLISAFDDSKNNKQSSSVSSESSPPDNTRRSFTTAEGIKVFVYKCSILRAPVDVIVNAANEDLRHTGGVAKVIADAAGREFNEESRKYIKQNDNLTVGASCITSGGNLNYVFVIHTVGPEWNKCSKTSEGIQKCMEDIWKAVIGCFFKAETLQVQSIALPAVSSGIYGVPMEICASQYLSAVMRYSKSTQGTSSLKEIHFIDVNKKILDLIELVFSATLENNQEAAKEFNDRLQRVLSGFGYPSTPQTLKSIVSFKKKGHSSEHLEPYDVLKMHTSKFHFTKAFKVLIYTGDITDSKCKAIVSSEDKDLKSQGGVAKAIRQKAGQKFDKSFASNRGRLRQVGDVIEIDAGNLKCQKVICCIVPKWTNSMSDEEYKIQVGCCFRSILEKAKTYKTVAMPLIGIGVKDNKIEICGRVLLDCLLQFSKALRQKEAIMEVHIISLDDGPIACVTSIFTEYFDSEKKKLDAERRKLEHMGVDSATTYEGKAITYGGLGDPPQNSGLQRKNSRQVSKSGEHNKARTEAAMYIRENLASYSTDSNQPPKSQKINRGGDDNQDNCAICLDTFDDPVKMKKCSHVFCKGCIDTQLQYKPVCPACGRIYGIITGNQPKGKMTEKIDKHSHLEGYNGCGIIEITYNMQSGVQGDDHPKPGQHYYGLYRNAYLPNNEKGLKVLHLLHLAFDRRLIFTIGRSVTSGKDDMVTWNDIHHKTNKYGGPQKYGYPDPTYLDRVLEELAAKGVTEESEHQDAETSIAYESIEQESSV